MRDDRSTSPEAGRVTVAPPGAGLLGRFLSWLARRSWFAATVLAGGMPVEGRVKYLRHIDEVRFGPLVDDDEGGSDG